MKSNQNKLSWDFFKYLKSSFHLLDYSIIFKNFLKDSHNSNKITWMNDELTWGEKLFLKFVYEIEFLTNPSVISSIPDKWTYYAECHGDSETKWDTSLQIQVQGQVPCCLSWAELSKSMRSTEPVSGLHLCSVNDKY